MTRFTRRVRRPSPALLVASVALFLSIGGASYAAVTIPNGSIGTAALKNLSVTNQKVAVNAVGWRKIIKHTVGTQRVNSNEVQLRVRGACTTPANQAITSVATNGAVTCGSTLPAEYDTTSASLASVTSSTQAATVASETLPTNEAFLVTANPNVEVQSTAAGNQNISVSCVLSVGGLTQTRTAGFDLTYKGDAQDASVPLSIAVPASSVGATAQVSCVRAVAPGNATPTVGVTTSINALQIASSTSTASPAPTATATITPNPTPPATPTTTITTTTPAS